LGGFAMGLVGSHSVCYRFIINVLYTKLQNPLLAFGVRGCCCCCCHLE
jgi:hypothetical protein